MAVIAAAITSQAMIGYSRRAASGSAVSAAAASACGGRVDRDRHWPVMIGAAGAERTRRSVHELRWRPPP